MQAIHAAIADLGTHWIGPTADQTLKLYDETYKSLLSTFAEPLRSDVRYGPAERNVLDIFAPDGPAEKPRSVIVYVHGGGFFAGDKSWTAAVYRNIGHYFASRGFLLVAINYRLVPEARYPSGGDDVGLALDWIRAHITELANGSGDPSQIILIGQSAGAAHIATHLYRDGDAELVRSGKAKAFPSGPAVRGVVYLSTPFFFDATKARRAQTLREYFGTDDLDKVWPLSAAGLLQAAPSSNPHVSPKTLPTLITVGQYDPKEIIDANFRFLDVYRERNAGVLPLFAVHPNHNHISTVLSIGTEDEEVGEVLMLFIKRALAHQL